MRTTINVYNNNTKMHISIIAFISKSLLNVSTVKVTVLRKKIKS
jgi:hypothetical protein